MQNLDAPLVAVVAGQVGGGGLGRTGAGDAELRDGRDVLAGGVGGVAFDQPDLPDVRERQVGRGGLDLDVRVVFRPWPMSVLVWVIGTVR
ncbi:hypothetical protein [Micromonospora tulbaghiae]|uniref:hypothetical protein n=1 Tax=Micromonospora tulbaghiae TaxID=479978 RepID=UPI003EC10537